MVYTTLGPHHHKYIIRRSAYLIIVVYANLIAVMEGGKELQHKSQIDIGDNTTADEPLI